MKRLIDTATMIGTLILYCLCLPYWGLQRLVESWRFPVRKFLASLPSGLVLRTESVGYQSSNRYRPQYSAPYRTLQEMPGNLRWRLWAGKHWLLRYLRSHDTSLAKVLVSAIPYTIVFVLAASPAFYLGVSNARGFNTPDEMAGYIVSEAFAQHGQFYFQDPITEANPPYSIGPRGFVESNGRAVAIYSLGHPFLFGIFHKLFGSLAPAVLAIVPGLAILALAILIRLLTPNATFYLGFLALGASPLWYWISRIYMNLSVTLLFLSWGLVCFILAIRHRSLGWYAAATSGFALAALMRNQEAPLLLIIAMGFTVIFLKQMGPFRWNSFLRVAGVYCIGQCVFFIIPLAIMNWQTYGSPFTVGYQVLYEQIHPERVPIQGNLALSAISFVKLAFFPAPISFEVLWKGVLYQIILMMPVLFLLGVAGLILARQRVTTAYRWGAFLLGVALVYLIISTSIPGVHLADAAEPAMISSLVRYWLPVYLAIVVGAAYALSHVGKIVALPLIISIVFLSTYQVWISSPEAILKLRSILERNSTTYGELLQQNTEPEAVVVASSPKDKFIPQWRRTIAIYLNDGTERSTQRVVRIAESIFPLGFPVYFLSNAADSDAIFELANNSLAQDQLQIMPITEAPYGGQLWEVKSINPILKLESVNNVTYSTQVESPGTDFSLFMDQDGSNRNLVANPSFETGLGGWSGPNVGGTNVSREQALVGESSMKMELTAQPGEAPYIRRTFAIKNENFAGDSFVTRIGVKVENLKDAKAVLRVFIDDYVWPNKGKRLGRYETSLSQVTDSFESLTLTGDIPPEAVNISIQVGIQASKEGGTGIVYWDSAEFRVTDKSLVPTCEVQGHGCVFNPGVTNGEKNGIDTIKVQAEGQAPVVLNGPFFTNDKLEFRNNAIFLDRMGYSLTRLTGFGPVEKGQKIELVISSKVQPSIGMTPRS